MTYGDLIAIIISLFSLTFAIRSSKIAQGEIEFQMAVLIRDGEYKVSELSLKMIEYEVAMRERLTKDTPELNEEEFEELVDKTLSNDKMYGAHESALEQAIETLLNAYEEACSKYLDKKIDTKRFMKSYHRDIRRIVESDQFAEHFVNPSSPYKCILRVYNEWYNLEKNK